MTSLTFRGPGDGLTVGDLRSLRIDRNPIFPLHPLELNVQVQFAQPPADRLAQLSVELVAEGGVFLVDLGEDLTQLVIVGPALPANSNGDVRLGEVDPLHRHGAIRRRQGVVGVGVLAAWRPRRCPRHEGEELPAVPSQRNAEVVQLLRDVPPAFFSSIPLSTVPLRTLKKESSPTWGSVAVLKIRAAVGPESSATRVTS